MAAVVNQTLEHQGAVAKGAEGLAPGAFDGAGQVLQSIGTAHAPPAAARRGLDQKRKTQFQPLGDQHCVVILGRAQVAGGAGYAGVLHAALGQRLVAHGAHGRRRRADKHQARVQAGLGKVGVFAQKAVAGVHRVGAAAPGGVKDGVYA